MTFAATPAVAPSAPPSTTTRPLATPEIVLRSSEFRRGREQGWRDLERLIGLVEKRGVRALAADELQQLPSLYRSALSSLSVARSIALDRNMLLYLENLVLRSFLAVYGPRTRLRDNLRDFLLHGFPAAVRAARWHAAVVLVAVIAGGIAGFMLVSADESWFSALVPSGLAGSRGPESTRAELLNEEIFAPWPGFAKSFVGFANILFTHNTMVGILAFSLGLGAGVPSILLMAYQGLILGAFLALHYNRDLTVDFLGWVSIHGVTEFTAIILCGAAGLVIAEKELFPGRYSRVESLSIHGRSAAQIAAGAVLLFLAAGILEGGFRQLVASTPWRFAFGAATGLAWLAYFLHRPRETTR